ncbi:tetratricopeptide repeat protein [Criblamydia sequanensis]|uniref:Uncharacterized protein n=1 Tax=Candidatus Criblamydia sequanensis CRIB-18 TaxID=1437425 RepID=A0A090CZG3_9BACT|nr:tetratricopeptide repeat protein [Criblamydia sequanensis]CDR34482.1 hypothetical protein CSEC_1669 [Criblamydia sequanensis CRIB-18]
MPVFLDESLPKSMNLIDEKSSHDEKEIRKEFNSLKELHRFDLILSKFESLPPNQKKAFFSYYPLSLFNRGQFDEAKIQALSCLKDHLGLSAKIECATLLAKLNENAKAKSFLGKIDQSKLNGTQTSLLIYAFLALKDYPAIESLLGSLKEPIKEDPLVKLAIAYYLMRLSNNEEAFDLAEKAAIALPNDSRPLNFFKKFEGREDIIKGQKALYEDFLSRENAPLEAKLDYLRILLELSIFYSKKGSVNDSKALLSKASIYLAETADEASQIPEWWRLKVLYSYLNNDLGETENSITTLHKLNPAEWTGYHIKALLEDEHNNFNEALETLQKALKFESDNPEIYEQLALLFLKNNQIEKAKESLNKAIEIMPNSAKLYLLGNKIALKEQNMKEAEAYLNKASDLTPKKTDKDSNLDE